ncbi:hypothetical protein H5410_055617, partial [Solanum commersonii]
MTPIYIGGIFSWFRGLNHPSAATLDRFILSMKWEEKFKNIKQKLLPREKKRSNFKFENWWLKVEGFTDLIQAWWNEFLVEGCPNYRLNVKLRMLKEKLKEWRNANFGKLVNKKNSLLEELAEIDELQGARDLTEDEMKKSRVLWKERNAKCSGDKSNNIQKIIMNSVSLLYFRCKQDMMGDTELFVDFIGRCGILNEEKRKGKEEKSEQDQGKEPVVVLQEYEE